MRPTTNLLLTLITISIFPFFTNGALQPQHPHAHGGGCIPAERAALLSFKEGITSNNTNLLASWQGQDCCRWRGVRCSNRTGHVIKLRLRNPNVTLYAYGYYYADEDANALFGEISPSLLSLKHLEHLDLSMNCLLGPDGQIPHFLGSMVNLRYLNLSGIPFTGTVPSQLGNLSKLQYLDLGHAADMYSTDITWLTKLSFLKFLSMRGITLEGIADWPHTLNRIPSLRVIDLSHCQLDNANQSLPHLNLTKLEKLDLSHNYFEHSLKSAWFWKATSLKYLDLGKNRLFGQFPDTLGNMTNLQVLLISENENTNMRMTGNLENLCSLEIIVLYGNGINGVFQVLMESLPQCIRKKLQHLDLEGNNFTGTLPNFIGDFTRLSILRLSYNSLVGPIPPQLGNLTCLTSLDLGNNHLTGNIPTEFGALTTLNSLYIHNNDLIQSIPAELGNLRYLTALELQGNEITGSIPPQLWNLTCLTSLDLSDNHLTGSTPAEVGKLTYLTSLDLSSNHLNGSVPTETGSLINLDFLDNNLKMVLNSDWRAPFKLASARFVSCQMGPLFPPWLQQLKTIALDISSNAIKSEFPDWFWSAFSHATYLDISNNQINGSLPAHMDSMAFEHLFLSSNRLTGPIRFLILSHNKFSDNIPVDITKLGYLQYLDLSGNNFSGAIPWHQPNQTFMTTLLEESMDLFVDVAYDFPALNKEEIGAERLGQTLSVNTKGQQLTYHRTLAYFVSIDLSCNSLTGEIPAYITSLVALMSLNLSSNQLSGQIPNMMGAMQSLESLDLSQNKLSGEIPSSLTNLTSLSYLDLSYNSLSGRIPSGPQLDTLSAENQSLMYIGNSGLCGPPFTLGFCWDLWWGSGWCSVHCCSRRHGELLISGSSTRCTITSMYLWL